MNVLDGLQPCAYSWSILLESVPTQAIQFYYMLAWIAYFEQDLGDDLLWLFYL